MFSCENCEIFKSNCFEEHLWTIASKQRSSFLEVFCKSCRSALINAVMKYSFSTAVVQSSRALHANILKIALHHRYFQRILRQVQNSHIEKCILMASSEIEFILETFLHGCFSNFLLWRHGKEERSFMIFFKCRFWRKVEAHRISFKFCSKTLF